MEFNETNITGILQQNNNSLNQIREKKTLFQNSFPCPKNNKTD